MPLYLIERTFCQGNDTELLDLEASVKTHPGFLENNALSGVTWIHSFVTTDKKKTFCLYAGPDPEALRKAAGLNELPIDRINEVQFQTPYLNPMSDDSTPSQSSRRKWPIDDAPEEISGD